MYGEKKRREKKKEREEEEEKEGRRVGDEGREGNKEAAGQKLCSVQDTVRKGFLSANVNTNTII